MSRLWFTGDVVRTEIARNIEILIQAAADIKDAELAGRLQMVLMRTSAEQQAPDGSDHRG